MSKTGRHMQSALTRPLDLLAFKAGFSVHNGIKLAQHFQADRLSLLSKWQTKIAHQSHCRPGHQNQQDLKKDVAGQMSAYHAQSYTSTVELPLGLLITSPYVSWNTCRHDDEYIDRLASDLHPSSDWSLCWLWWEGNYIMCQEGRMSGRQ